LEQLDLSGTQLAIDAVVSIFRIVNPRLRLQINLSQNGYARDAAQTLAVALKVGGALVALDVSDNAFGDEGVQVLAEALYHHRGLTRLHVDRNFRYASVKARRDCVNALSQLITASALPLSGLTMAASSSSSPSKGSSSKDKDARLKDALVPLLIEVGQARRLTSLDVSGHAVGDAGIIALGKALETTRSLRRVLCDDNGCTLVGLRALTAALAVNRTLTEFPLPLVDVTRMMSSDDADKVLSTVATLEERLRRNQRL
jgi:Ran GTPase-activating protein (RanGAP) involved in mRNA processing and transport